MVADADAGMLRRLVNELPAMVAYWTPDLRLLLANAAYCDFVGAPAQQLRGKHFATVLGDDVYEANLPYLRAALARERQAFERTLTNESGKIRHTEVSYGPDVVAGEVVGVFALISDITERVEAQRDLDEAQELGGLASWAFRPREDALTWSRTLYRLAGLDPESDEADWDAYLARVHPEDREMVDALRERVLGGVSSDLRYRLVVDGDVRHVHTRTKAIFDDLAGPHTVQGTIQDETESVRQAAALAAANQRLADVIAMVGHDVRQPLGVTLGYLEHVLDTWDRPELREGVDPALQVATLRGPIEKAFAAAERTNSLLDDILSMVEDESGELVVRPEVRDLAELVAECLEDPTLAVQPRLEIRGTASVDIDPFHLRQILANLLSNAARYGAPPVTVTVAATRTAVQLHVSDRGVGVPEEFVPRLFDRFARGDAPASGTSRSTGFGLHLVRELVRANAGTITYRPAKPTGAEFSVSFARSVRDTRATAARDGQPS